ncbi:tail fiber protein [Hymenobacter agri]
MDEFIGIVKLFAGSYAPQNWAFCNGQILPINQYQALFSLLGTTYGGNGTTTFALPNLMGRVAVGAGSGAGLPVVQPGQAAGAASVTLTTNNLPAHTHLQQVATQTATTSVPGNSVLPGKPNGVTSGSEESVAINNMVTASGATLTPLAAGAIGNTGGNQAVNVMPPYLGMNYIICLNGVYPSRS